MCNPANLRPFGPLFLNFDFQNGPDSVVLVAEGAVVDALGYGTFAPDEVFAGAQPRPRASTLTT